MKNVMRLCLCAAAVLVALGPAFGAGKTVRVGEYTISGPYTHKNLAVFVVHGKDKVKGKTFLTLDEALAKKLVVVHETSNVQQLSIENRSPSIHIYVQSGVIVKGGKQDRTIRYDMVIPPKSGKVPLASFCVESGRWSQRGGEAAGNFDSAKGNLATKELKIAAKLKGSQQEVWNGVAKAQGDLAGNLNESVQAGQSATSLQLTLENKKLRKTAQEYAAALAGAFAGKKDVVGYAFAINGEINSADVYGSNGLFVKLLPTLLEASSVEAIAKLKKDKPFAAPTADAVKKLFLEAEKGKKSETDLTKGVKMIIKDSDKSVLFRVNDKNAPDACYRLEIIKK